MGKKAKVTEVVSDGSEKFLVELIERFSVKRAVEWLRIKFPSFDTSRAEALACDATKNEKEYFVSAELLGYVTRFPEGGCGHAGRVTIPAEGTRSVAFDDTNKPLLVAAIKMRKDLTERTSRLVQFNYAKKLLQNAIVQGAQGVSGLPSQGLFFFYDKDGYFRLSLVTGEVEKRRFKYNEAKRQSFYIEPNAANNIVKRRLTPPIKTFSDLKDVFSVEQLTKEFYTKLFDWYTWAMSTEVNVHFPNDIADRTDDRKYNNEAIIRMITRLMFTWFIRQRKLVPDELFDKNALKDILRTFEPGSMERDNYYRAILQNLFFATFNCQPDKRRFIHTFQGKSNERHVTTLYRYEREFREAESFKRLMKKVPFLNCALFDCLDKIERPEDGGHELYFDGFSGQGTKYQAFVPNGLFFDDERGIINLFNLYEFTVNENNADDSDVALDPELLGKVFENLLGAFNPETQETARNATGSFYTPREIVDYMVEESLKNYLKSRLKVEGGARDVRHETRGGETGDARQDGASRLTSRVLGADFDAKLDDLFDRNKAAEGAETLFSLKEREAILSTLYGCKILDPACGSGAFPMGILHCMVRLLSRLDPQCLSIRDQLLARYKEDKATVDPAETAAERQERLEELENRLKEGQHYPDYERKLYLIENCIYGVDIQPIATQISKLRFFISLLCDQLRSSYDPDAENFGLLSLPNLEAKFVCANTLISLPDIEGELKIGDLEELRKELQANRHKIFRARSTRTKEKYKAKDREIRDKIRQAVYDAKTKPDEDVIEKCRAEIEEAKKRREAVAAPRMEKERRKVEAKVQHSLFDILPDEPLENQYVDVSVDRNKPAREKIDAEIAWAEEKIKDELKKAEKSNVTAATQYAKMVAGWDPYDQNASSKFFDAEWMFNIKDGFDVVIGNPPYVQLQANGGELAKMYQGCGYETFDRTGDLYCLFYERGWQLLNESGILCYITSDKWMRNDYGQSLRQFFLTKADCRILIDITGQQVFESAVVEANILLFAKANIGKCEPLALDAKMPIGNAITNSMASLLAPCKFESSQSWAILSPLEHGLKKKVETVGVQIKDWDLLLNRGLVTGLNPAFLIDNDTRNELIKDDGRSIEIIKPVLRGRDVQRYSYSQPMWIIDTHNGVKDKGIKRIAISNYPAIKKHLDRFKAELERRGDQGDTPYNLRDCAYWQDLGKEKIVWGELSDRAKFVISTAYIVNTCVFMAGNKLHYILGVLNSKLAEWYFGFIATKSGMGTTRWYKGTVEQLPLVKAPSAQELAIENLVDRILAAKKQDPEADTSVLEDQIDRLVYKLYALTEEEIAVVEGRETRDGKHEGETGDARHEGETGDARHEGEPGDEREDARVSRLTSRSRRVSRLASRVTPEPADDDELE